MTTNQELKSSIDSMATAQTETNVLLAALLATLTTRSAKVAEVDTVEVTTEATPEFFTNKAGRPMQRKADGRCILISDADAAAAGLTVTKKAASKAPKAAKKAKKAKKDPRMSEINGMLSAALKAAGKGQKKDEVWTCWTTGKAAFAKVMEGKDMASDADVKAAIALAVIAA